MRYFFELRLALFVSLLLIFLPLVCISCVYVFLSLWFTLFLALFSLCLFVSVALSVFLDLSVDFVHHVSLILSYFLLFMFLLCLCFLVFVSFSFLFCSVFCFLVFFLSTEKGYSYSNLLVASFWFPFESMPKKVASSR